QEKVSGIIAADLESPREKRPLELAGFKRVRERTEFAALPEEPRGERRRERRHPLAPRPSNHPCAPSVRLHHQATHPASEAAQPAGEPDHQTRRRERHPQAEELPQEDEPPVDEVELEPA